jgi:hypothetical protein
MLTPLDALPYPCAMIVRRLSGIAGCATAGRVGPSLVAAILLLCVLCVPEAGAPQACPVRRVPRDELVRAMRMHGDFEILATTNRGRFTSELLLRLARWAKQRDPEGKPLYVDPGDWFSSYIEVAEVSAADAPLPARLGFEHRQRVLIEYREDRVIREVREGKEPSLAVNVRGWWPDGPGVPSSFGFIDTTAVPRIKATSQRDISYRLLQFDDMVVLDQIDGLSGRPVSGVLGALFSVIGEGGLKQSRIGVSDDGLQVARGRAKKVLSVSTTITIEPDGRGKKGIPEGRPDLAALEARLKSPLDIEYVPYSWERLVEGCLDLLNDHPAIAKVLDAGATEQGRPYFVMELVRGRHPRPSRHFSAHSLSRRRSTKETIPTSRTPSATSPSSTLAKRTSRGLRDMGRAAEADAIQKRADDMRARLGA